MYIKNRLKENDKAKPENKKNIVYDLKSYFERCYELLEKLYKDSLIQKKEKEYFGSDEIRSNANLNLKKLFDLSFIRVYLKIFIDWIDKDKLTKSNEIKEIIKIINGEENNPFREMMQCFAYKILYNMNQQDINKLFDEKLNEKFHLDKYSSFYLLKKEKNLPQSFKDILLVYAYKNEDIKAKKLYIEHKYNDFETYENIFNNLNNCLQNSGDEENNELEELINENTFDIFYSVFSTKISSYLSNYSGNGDKIKIFSDIIY